MRTLFLSLLCMYGALNALQAQGGNYGIAYQAVARDADGDPIAGSTIDVRVTLRNGAETVLWTETHNGVVTSEFGNIALTFGSITAGLESVDWSAAGLHFHIEVNAGGGYQSFGEVNVTAVPVAMYALNGQEDEIAVFVRVRRVGSKSEGVEERGFRERGTLSEIVRVLRSGFLVGV